MTFSQYFEWQEKIRRNGSILFILSIVMCIIVFR